MSKEGLYKDPVEGFFTRFTEGGCDAWDFENDYWLEWQGDCQEDQKPPLSKTPFVLPEEYLT